ncbi:N-acetylglucosamine-6-phosphate deacetylase [Sagittula sp. SSi028]|uniref:N-acetylglucosamine-6-phosphate deacetylase n=1 Tax=Sagittula sp. SSi028 TaxID=3400636 RepID=UPI003AF931AA
MMQAIKGQVFDGQRLWAERVLFLDAQGRILDDVAGHDTPVAYVEGVLMPGFVDLQVNGGDGVMLGEALSPDGVARIAAAHQRLGCAGILPTLITDRPAQVTAAIAAVAGAIAQGASGVLGLHLEGPHLDPVRKGAHDATLIRPMTDADCAELVAAAAILPNLKVTLAPENVGLAQIRRLADAGVIVSLGHSDCSYETARAAFDAGASCVTHLFNAMSGLGHRAPGLVGAALDSDVAVGVIADGEHVHPAALRAALNAKQRGAIFAVSDAMAVAGSDLDSFDLGGRRVLRGAGRLTLADGTLAGADLTLARAATGLTEMGQPLERALAMVSSVPASVLRDPMGCGRLRAGVRVLHLNAGEACWLGQDR